MEWAFILGMFTGVLIPAAFAAWAAWHEGCMRGDE